MKVFDVITKSPEALADQLAVNKDSHGCSDCSYKDNCTGKDSCRAAWLDYLNSEVDPPTLKE